MIAVIADEPGESEGRISAGGETAEFGLDVARQGSARSDGSGWVC
jgi:hypothetical protein